MGWQGDDPATDLRSAGLMSLRHLLAFGRDWSEPFQRLLNKQDGTRSTWEYPFAVAGVNVRLLPRRAKPFPGCPPSDVARRTPPLPASPPLAQLTFTLVDTLGILPLALGRSKSSKVPPCVPFLRLLERDPRVRARAHARPRDGCCACLCG